MTFDREPHDPDAAARIYGRQIGLGDPYGVKRLPDGWLRYNFRKGFTLEVWTAGVSQPRCQWTEVRQ